LANFKVKVSSIFLSILYCSVMHPVILRMEQQEARTTVMEAVVIIL